MIQIFINMDLNFDFLLALAFNLILLRLFSALVINISSSLHHSVFLSFVVFTTHLHELTHYFAALFMLKWPKYEGVKLESKSSTSQISGRVTVKNYSYKSLFYNMFNGSFVIEGAHLLHQVIAGFVIGLSPIISAYLSLYLFSDYLNFWLDISSYQSLLNSIFNIKILLFFPLFFFFSLVSSPSIEDLKHSVPLLVILMFFPTSNLLINFLNTFSVYLLIFIIILIFYLLFLRIRKI